MFVDSGGAFNNDTECVNGSRGNAADHLTKDVVPYMVSNFGVSADRANWGIVGWSMGGTCAVDLAVMHPDMFSAFEDIAGDIGPNSGTKDQTIARLFGGNADAWAAFDPTTVITRHGPLHRIGRLVRHQRLDGDHLDAAKNDQAAAANSLCALGSRQRDQLRGGQSAGQARLAVRVARLRRRPAVAGRPDRHARRSADPVTRSGRGASFEQTAAR